jgi:multiple sugar transport system permease protein
MTLKTPVSMDTEVLVTGVAHSRRRRQLRRTTESYGFLAPTLILLLVLMIVPIVMVIGYSLQSNVILSKHSEFVGLENYLTVLGDATFWKATSNTVVFTVVSVAAHLVLGLGFALMLNSPLIGGFSRADLPRPLRPAVAVHRRRHRRALAHAARPQRRHQLPAPVSDRVARLPAARPRHRDLHQHLGRLPFFMVSLLAGLQGIPSDLYEAATVDGASSVQRFWNVTLPQLRPSS